MKLMKYQHRSHAYEDLKAYICTYGGKNCDSEMFVDRATWFNHELRVHRSCFTCKLCDEQMEEEEDLRNHVLSDHANFPSTQLPILLEQGRLVPSQLKARDCPFCDDWARSLYSKRNPQSGQTQPGPNYPDILVELSKFKKHVATHQEQLAIFTVPKSTDYDGLDESGQNAGSDVSVHRSEESPAMSDASDTFVVETADVNANVEEKDDIAIDKTAEKSMPRVLIAEDNPINLAVLRRLLLHEGIQDITAAKDGQEAYDIVKEDFERNDKFDLIFMDIQMPRLSGLASTQLIRTLGCDTPIVAVTPASSDTSRAHELIQRGVNEVILKPFRQPTIRKVLQRFAIVSGDVGRPSGTRELHRELHMFDSYYTPTVDVESVISPLEAFLATASSGDLGESAGNDSDISSVTALIAEALSSPGRVKMADLIDVLPNLHHNEIMNLRTEYKRLVKTGPDRKGVNVAKHIRARLKDDDIRFMTAAYATALGMWESEGYWISLSLTIGNGTRKGQQLLIESLFGRSNTQARLIEDGFRIHSNKLERERGTSLEGFLDPYLRQGAAWFREAVKTVLSGQRMEEIDHSGQPLPIDMQLVEKDVDELFEAVAGERGAETTISQIVVLRSDAHLREVLTIYQRKYDSDFFTDALKGTVQLRVGFYGPLPKYHSLLRRADHADYFPRTMYSSTFCTVF